MTPLQEELGTQEYARLADAWRMRLWYSVGALRNYPYFSLPERYVEEEDHDDALSA